MAELVLQYTRLNLDSVFGEVAPLLCRGSWYLYSATFLFRYQKHVLPLYVFAVGV